MLFVSGDLPVYLTHVRFAVDSGTAGKLLHGNAIDMLFDISGYALARYRAGEFLTQIWLPARPVKYSVQCGFGVRHRQVQLVCEQIEISPRKVGQLNWMCNRERREIRVFYEARRIAFTYQYETEPREVGLGNPGVVRRANTG